MFFDIDVGSDVFHAALACVELINSAKTVVSQEQLDAIDKQVELHVTAVEQHTTSVQSGTRSARKVVGRRQTDSKKKKTAAEEELEEKKQKSWKRKLRRLR